MTIEALAEQFMAELKTSTPEGIIHGLAYLVTLKPSMNAGVYGKLLERLSSELVLKVLLAKGGE